MRDLVPKALVLLTFAIPAACDSSTASPQTFLLRVMEPPEGAGTVQSQPGGILCPPTCSAWFSEEDVVYLSASPSAEWQFLGWSSECVGTGGLCSLRMTGPVLVTATFDAMPQPPRNLLARTVSASRIDVSWTDASVRETNFRIERQRGVSGGWNILGSVPQDTESYSDTGLAAGTTYSYRVRPCTPNKCSGYRETAEATTLPDLLPTPRLEPIPITQARIDLTWAVTPWGQTRFELERSREGSATWGSLGVFGAEVLALSDTDLLPGTTYHYRVRACYEDTCTDFSTGGSARTYPPFSDLKGGRLHTCGTTPSGSAFCWGEGSDGQLGNGQTGSRQDTPGPVLGGHTFSSVAPGAFHTCALTASGQAYCWGRGNRGALGIGEVASDDKVATPTFVSDAPIFHSLDSGFQFTCGLTPEGKAYCWGQGDYGQLGNGTFADQHSPVPVAGGLVFRSLAVGDRHACALSQAGETWCWGAGFGGRLGNGSAENQSAPVPVVAPPFASIHAGGSHTCALTATGEAWCWGMGEAGQLGDGSMADQDRAVLAAGGLTFLSLGLGGAHTCGLTPTGQAYCWGQQPAGEPGTGSDIHRPTPERVSEAPAFSYLGCGGLHACGVTPSGQALCWGENLAGQLGVGPETVSRTHPVPTLWR